MKQSTEQATMPTGVDRRATALTQRRYDRIAPVYDALESVMELRFRGWRRKLWELVDGERILELGVGTGKNLRYYPDDRSITAIDISTKMLERAKRKAQKLGTRVLLEQADAQRLPFEDERFDTVVATFLFCSVPNPSQGLAEAQRVLRPCGTLLLLEHVLSEIPVLKQLMKFFDPIPARIWGAHINRETVKMVGAAGFEDLQVVNRSLDIVKQITARASRRSP